MDWRKSGHSLFQSTVLIFSATGYQRKDTPEHKAGTYQCVSLYDTKLKEGRLQSMDIRFTEHISTEEVIWFTR
jgi:hypothetical protein